MIILFFGQPSSGKTTLADAFVKEMEERKALHDFIRADGDEWRKLSDNKDYSKKGRMSNLKSAFMMAKHLDNLGFTPVLSFVTPYEELRQYLRQNTIVAEIHLTCSEDRGRNNYFATDFQEPTGECLSIDTSLSSIESCVDKVIEFCEKKSKRIHT